MATLNIEVQSQVDQAVRDLGRISKGFDLMGKANQDAAGALGVFGISLTSLSNPLTLVAGTVKASIDYTLKYSDSIDQLARVTGTGAREASILATVMGDLNVDTGMLEQASKALKEKGLTPSLETIKKLSVEYRAIQDPAERNKFLFDNLGRAGLGMADALDRDISQFDELARAAQSSGKILDEAMIQRMEEAQIKTQQYADKLDGLKISVGTFAVDGLGKAVTGGEDYVKMWQAIIIKTGQAIGVTDDVTATWQAAMLMGADYNTTLENMGLAYDVEDVRARRAAEATSLHTDATVDAKAAEDALKASKDLSNEVYTLAEVAIGKANIGLAQQIELTEALALASGKLTLEDLATQEAIGFLTKQLELGKITMDEYKAAVDALASGATNARDIVNQVGAAINGLPTSKDIYVNVHTNAAAGEVGIGPTAPIPSGPEETPSGGRFQHGGSFIIPSGYHENFPIGPRGGASSGERVTVSPAGGGGGGAEYQMMLLQMESRMTRAFRDALLLARG